MKANLTSGVMVFGMLLLADGVWAQTGSLQPPVIAKALSENAFKAQVQSDAQQAASGGKNSQVHTKFLQTYFPKGKEDVDSVADYFKRLCVPGVGEGCGVAEDLLRGAHYEGCVGGVGEGCGKSGKSKE